MNITQSFLAAWNSSDVGQYARSKDGDKPKSWKPSLLGGESKGKQSSLFDTKGDKDQMMMFDDGVTPQDRLFKPESASLLSLDRYEWNSAEHPRQPVGNAKGGEFAPAKKLKATDAEKEQAYSAIMANKSDSDKARFSEARKDGVAIPPDWTEITYYGLNGRDGDGGILAEGRDKKGRKQRSENPAYRQRLSDKNNARIASELTPKMPAIRDQLKRGAIGGSEEEKCLYLIAETGFRIGGKGDGKAAVEAFGASTLQGKHATVKGDTVTFSFTGKKGVAQDHSITDKVVADFVRDIKPNELIFRTNAAKVRLVWQGKYGGEKVHDIRHVVASELASRELLSRIPPIPSTKKAKASLMKSVSTVVGNKLGNNPAQAQGTYIDPGIWQPLTA